MVNHAWHFDRWQIGASYCWQLLIFLVDRNTSFAVHVLILVFVVMPDREARTSRGRAWENAEKRREKLADLIVGGGRLSDRCEPLSWGIFSNDRLCIDGVLLGNELQKSVVSVEATLLVAEPLFVL